MYVHDAEHDSKYSVFYGLKLQFISDINSSFFWSSKFLLVGGRLVCNWCIWLVVGWLVGWSVGRWSAAGGRWSSNATDLKLM